MGSQQQITMTTFEVKIMILNIPSKEFLAEAKILFSIVGKHPL